MKKVNFKNDNNFKNNTNKLKNVSELDFSSSKIKFVGETADDLEYKPSAFKDSFYQICQYKDPKTNMHKVRKVIFDEKYEPIGIFEKEYNTKIIKNFIKKSNNNKYKIYPINELSYLAPPNSSDFMCVHSDLTGQKINTKWNNMQCYDEYNDCAFGGILNSHTMASPGSEISIQKRKVGSAPKQFYDGAPTDDNLLQINNNLIGRNGMSKYKRF
jgi:hypothetical protein